MQELLHKFQKDLSAVSSEIRVLQVFFRSWGHFDPLTSIEWESEHHREVEQQEGCRCLLERFYQQDCSHSYHGQDFVWCILFLRLGYFRLGSHQQAVHGHFGRIHQAIGLHLQSSGRCMCWAIRVMDLALYRCRRVWHSRHPRESWGYWYFEESDRHPYQELFVRFVEGHQEGDKHSGMGAQVLRGWGF